MPPSGLHAAVTTPALRCLRGEHAPGDLAANLRVLAGFSPDARRQVWGVLGPTLGQKRDAGTDDAVVAFAAVHHVQAAELSRALRACRFLLRAAAKTNLSLEDFEADLALLVPPGPHPDSEETQASVALRQLLRVGYPAALASLQREMVLATLADHGRVLLAADWRIDKVMSSERGEMGGVKVAVLTLEVQEGPQKQRITIHALPEEVRTLRDLCTRLLSSS
jgi:hypothetical protein